MAESDQYEDEKEDDEDEGADKEQILTDAKAAFENVVDFYSEQREVMRTDYDFARKGEQWPEEVRKDRELEGRPCHTLNRLPSFIRQVVNDARQNKPAIRCYPVDDNADVEVAEVLNGLIRNIEYRSDAGAAYDTAIDHAASMGVGYFRINVEYTVNDQFSKDIVIERVMNPFSVYGDPDSTAVDSSDWNIAFVTEWITAEEFKRRYPNAEPVDWDFIHDQDRQEWFEEDHIRLAEYWKREEVTKTLLMLSDGQVMYEDAFEEGAEFFDALGITVEETRETKSYEVTQYIMNGQEVLEENEWAGQYIPIVPVYGEEILDDGKRMHYGLTHETIDAQRMYNYWRTTSTELVALAPKAPWIGEEGAFDVDDNWGTANTKSHAYLEYSRGQQPPMRQPFAGVPAGALQEAMSAADDMKSILGMFDASLGNSVNEVSGIAIQRRNQEGDTSTFHFQDNLTRAIRHAGRIIVDLIPSVYNKERIVRVLGEDEAPINVPINQPMAQSPLPASMQVEQQGERIYDLTTGKYDVIVKAGPNYTTKRQEAAEQMMQMVSAYPAVAPYIGDLIAKNLDWPGADEISRRLKALLPPEVTGEDDPQVQALQQQMQQMQAQNQALNAQLQAALDYREIERGKVQIDGIEADIKREEMKIKAYEAETERMEAEWKYKQGNDKNMISLVDKVKSAQQTAPGPIPGNMNPRGM